MSYFNHAFKKVFLGTKSGSANPDPCVFTEAYVPAAPGGVLTQAGIDHGFILSSVKTFGGTDRIRTADLQGYGMGPGTYAFFNPTTYQIVNEADLEGCCPLILASASIRLNDKIGPFHGGYQESNKSKIINPKYVQRVYRALACDPQQSVISIGTTPYTQSLNPADASCCKQFLCGETYYLRIDLKGSPVLRTLNHNAYQTIAAYTGCCPETCPTDPCATNIVDPTTVYITWAAGVLENNYLKNFVAPVVFDYNGDPWYAPGSATSPAGLPIPLYAKQGGGFVEGTWDNYPLSVAGATWTDDDPCAAGMRLYGAFVETKFQNCTFQLVDHYEKEPVRIYASLVDYTGDPCTFEGLCVYHECDGVQGNGFGETVIRELILSESYLQNFFHSDLRIREITGGTDNFIVDRTNLYSRYFIQHSVPRFNNPTSTFDNDQYLLEIVVAEDQTIPFTAVGSASLEDFLNVWLGNGHDQVPGFNCAPCDINFTDSCTHCVIIPDYTPQN